MPGTRVENSPSFNNRKHDITSWQEDKINALSSREKKRYHRRKYAVIEYFTTDAPLEEIASQHHLSPEVLVELAEKCTLQHRDGEEWGFRALMPGVQVVDYATTTTPATPATPATVATEDAEKQAVELRSSDGESPIAQEDIPDNSREESNASEAGQSSILIDEAVEEEEEERDTGKQEAIDLFSQHATFAMDVPETPFPLFEDGEDEEENGSLAEEESEPAVAAEQPTADEQQAGEEEQLPEQTAEPIGMEDSAVEAQEVDVEDETRVPTEKLTRQATVEDKSTADTPEMSTDAEDTVKLADESVQERPAADISEVPVDVENTVNRVDESAQEQAVDTPEVPVDAENTVNQVDESAQEQPVAGASETDREPELPEFLSREPGLEDLNFVDANEVVDEETQRSLSAEDAIAEAERIVIEHEDNSGEDEDAPGPGVEEEERFALAKVTRPMRALAVNVAPLVIPMPAQIRTYTIPKRAAQRRLVHRRWQRDIQGQSKNKRVVRIVSVAAVVAILLFVLVPVGAGMAAYGAYNNISSIAHDGVDHLLKVKGLLNFSKTDYTSALDAEKLQQAQIEFRAAQSDFTQLQELVNRPDVQGAITQFAPQYSNKLVMAQSLIQVAMDVSRMGDELSAIGLIGADIIHGSPLASGSTKPLLSTADVQAIEGSMVHALYYISDIRAQMNNVSIKDLPISQEQKNQIASLMPLLPQAQDMIVQAQGLVGLVTWLLGVGHPRRFLIQTMDRAELRPGGGFTGQYGIVQIQDGRMSPLSLTDVTLIDYAGNGTAIGRTAPPGYSWMNFGNWGVRDSNLSGDFPTTARMTMQLFQDEGGGPLDGDIAFTPALIGNILDVVGPIKVPGYNETITSKNLEDRLHYYQQDFSAIAREKQISGDYTHAGRKAFTSTLAKMLLDRVRHLKPKQLIEVGKSAIKSIQSRDLEIYFA
ncbi:MAG: DUF4012 domain-containing protein, partial [Ktedonobacteraceae bacterium]